MKLDRVIAVRNSKTVYRDGDNCIKVFDKDYSVADVLNEALNHARVLETGLKIPQIREVTMIDGKWAIVYEYIKGKTLAQLMQENPEKKEEYLELFVNLQIEVQSKTCPLLNKLKDKMNRKISQADLDATTRYDLHTRLEGMPKHNKLCHGDFNPSNIIIADDGTPYIIDCPMLPKEMLPLTQQEPIYYSGSMVISPVQMNIQIYIVRKPAQKSTMSKNGCQLSLLLNPLKETKKNVSSY